MLFGRTLPAIPLPRLLVSGYIDEMPVSVGIWCWYDWISHGEVPLVRVRVGVGVSSTGAGLHYTSVLPGTAMSDNVNGNGGLSNPLLQQIESQIEAGLTPENRQNYLRIVTAGGHLANANNGAMLLQLSKAPDPIAAAAKGAVGLVLIMRKETQAPGKVPMPMKAAVPAAMTLMVNALDFISRSKIAPVGQPELERATHIFTDFLFARMGITKAGLASAAQKIHGLTQDPQSMQAIQMKAGLLKHPMAATPTPLPPGRGSLMNSTAMGGGTA